MDPASVEHSTVNGASGEPAHQEGAEAPFADVAVRLWPRARTAANDERLLPEYHLSVEHRLLDLRIQDGLRRALHDVVRKNDEVGEVAGAEAAGHVLLAGGVGRAHSVGADRCFDAETLLWVP